MSHIPGETDAQARLRQLGDDWSELAIAETALMTKAEQLVDRYSALDHRLTDLQVWPDTLPPRDRYRRLLKHRMVLTIDHLNLAAKLLRLQRDQLHKLIEAETHRQRELRRQSRV